MTLFGHSVLFEAYENCEEHCVGEDTDAVARHSVPV